MDSRYKDKMEQSDPCVDYNSKYLHIQIVSEKREL